MNPYGFGYYIPMWLGGFPILKISAFRIKLNISLPEESIPPRRISYPVRRYVKLFTQVLCRFRGMIGHFQDRKRMCRQRRIKRMVSR
jgi:hypothetical protein